MIKNGIKLARTTPRIGEVRAGALGRCFTCIRAYETSCNLEGFKMITWAGKLQTISASVNLKRRSFEQED
jgi:hypothetical protein